MNRPSRFYAVGLLLTGLLILWGGTLAATSSPASAPTPTPPGQEAVLIAAPTRAIAPPQPGVEQSSHARGFIPMSIDLSHLTGQQIPEGIRTQALPSAWDWRDTGKVTSVKNQSICGSCYAFAALGNIEAKMLMDSAGTYNFSENNAKECNWYETSGTGGGTSCDGGNYALLANLFSKKGTVLEADDPYVASDVSCNSSVTYQKTLLDWRYISDGVPDTSVLKQYIYDHGPVYTALYSSFSDFNDYDGSEPLYYTGSETPDHAVLIVGWDDNISHAGGNGVWIVKNSWGTSWGKSGYFEIAYGSASIGTSSSFMYAWQDYDSDGDLWYYDEGGMATAYGCGTTTAWGLAGFTPDSDTYVTRVEFWTSDRTTDVDVYLYDDFDGSTLSNKLAEKLDNSFYESGYHSVAFSSPVAVSNGDDVFAVIKVTNNSYTYPIVVDTEGPSETGRTYASCNGSSWTDMGTDYGADVGLRLRVSTTGGVNQPPTISGLPDRELLKNTSRDNAIDLWEYASDDKDADSDLDFSISNSPVVSAGVSIDSDRYVDINPATDWTGTTAVEIQVQDSGGLTATDTFSVTVADTLSNQAPTLKDLPNQTLAMNDSSNNAIDLWAYADDTQDSDADLDFSITNSPDAGAGVSIDSNRYVDINPATDWSGTTAVEIQVEDSGDLVATDTFSVTVTGSNIYLPAIGNCWPLAPSLSSISNSDGDGVYTLEWSWPSCGPSPSYYQLQGDSNSQFSSPDSFTVYDTDFEAYSPSPATYYWRVRAYLSGRGWEDWSNIQSTTVTSSRAYVWVDNDTGGSLTVEIVGVATKSFSTGYHYWRSISPGTYTYKAWARCGSGTWSDYFAAGENDLEFWCSYGGASTSEILGAHALQESPQAIQDLNAMP